MKARKSLLERVMLRSRILVTFARVQLLLRLRPLPELVAALRASAPRRPRSYPPARLGRAVIAALRLGPYQPRCLVNSLVLYRLLLEEGHDPALVIGMPENAESTDAHAWVEIAGRDVGPPPGRGPHQELMRLN